MDGVEPGRYLWFMAFSRAPTVASSRPLTEREREVMAYVAAHYRSKAISRVLGTSPKTIDTQIANACRKLGVTDRAEAVRILIASDCLPRIGENPLEESSPLSSSPVIPVDPGVTLGVHDDETAPPPGQSGRPVTPPELRGSGPRPGEHSAGRQSLDGALSGFGATAAGPLPDGSDGPLRDPEIRQLPRRRPAPGFPPQLTTPSRGGTRLLMALLLALALSIGISAALTGAVALQKTIEELQTP